MKNTQTLTNKEKQNPTYQEKNDMQSHKHCQLQSTTFKKTEAYSRIKDKLNSIHYQNILKNLAEYGIYYEQNKHFQWHNFVIQNVKTNIDQFVIELDVRIGLFATTILILNLNEYKYNQSASFFGSFGQISLTKYCGEQYAIKKTYHCFQDLENYSELFEQRKGKKEYINWLAEKKQKLQAELQTKILYCVRQVAILKICSALKIGPFFPVQFFDIVFYKDSFCYMMEKCTNIFDTSINNKLETDLKENLEILHCFRIVHHDIKPENIMYSPKYKKYIFIDFGCSKILSQPIGFRTHTKFAGTYCYASDQVKALFKKGGRGLVDLYENDWHCLKVTLEQVKKTIKKFTSKQMKQEGYIIPISKYRNFIEKKTEASEPAFLNKILQLNEIKYKIWNHRFQEVLINKQLIIDHRNQIKEFVRSMSDHIKMNSLILLLRMQERQQIQNPLKSCNGYNFVTLHGKGLSENQLQRIKFTPHIKALFSYLISIAHIDPLVEKIKIVKEITTLTQSLRTIFIDSSKIKQIQRLLKIQQDHKLAQKQILSNFYNFHKLCFELIVEYLQSTYCLVEEKIAIKKIIFSILQVNSYICFIFDYKEWLLLIKSLELTFYEQVDTIVFLAISQLEKQYHQRKSIDRVRSIYNECCCDVTLASKQCIILQKIFHLISLAINVYNTTFQPQYGKLNESYRVKVNTLRQLQMYFVDFFDSNLKVKELKNIFSWIFYDILNSQLVFFSLKIQSPIIQKLDTYHRTFQLCSQLNIDFNFVHIVSPSIFHIKISLSNLLSATHYLIRAYEIFGDPKLFHCFWRWQHFKKNQQLNQRAQTILTAAQQIINQEIEQICNFSLTTFSKKLHANLQHCLFTLGEIQLKCPQILKNDKWISFEKMLVNYYQKGNFTSEFKYRLFFHEYKIWLQNKQNKQKDKIFKAYLNLQESNQLFIPGQQIGILYQIQKKEQALKYFKRIIQLVRYASLQLPTWQVFKFIQFDRFLFSIMIKQELHEFFFQFLTPYCRYIQQAKIIAGQEQLIISLYELINKSPINFLKRFYKMYTIQFYEQQIIKAPILVHFHLYTLNFTLRHKSYEYILKNDFKLACIFIQFLPLRSYFLYNFYLFILKRSNYKEKKPRLYKFILNKFIGYMWRLQRRYASKMPYQSLLKLFHYFIKRSKRDVIHKKIKQKQKILLGLFKSQFTNN